MNTRIESDLLGEINVPLEAYYGVQTQRAIENFNISTARLSHYRHFIWGLGVVNWQRYAPIMSWDLLPHH